MRAEDFFVDPPTAALAQAAARGDSAEVDALVAAGADPNAIGRDGMTPLLWALGVRNKAGMRALLARGADPNRAADGMSPVTLAAGAEDPELLRMLLDAGGDPSQREGERPAVVIATDNMRWDNLRLLLDRGADIDARDDLGMTALYTTAVTNQFEQTAYLLERGADPGIPNRAGGTVAYLVDTRQLDPSSDAARWRTRVKQMLIARGVGFPAATPAQVRASGAR